jgi:asparagine synthase (glutamine-hydrolysing)
MCGICGQFNYLTNKPADGILVKKMADALIHRGPDAEGFFVKNNIALGHRRLSIIDLEGGSQPIFNEDKTVAVVYNGEIYNFLELRQELIARGHTFTTRTDTEVIVHLYEEQGIDLVKSLRGMFAFALWDDKKHDLFLVRDRIGEKPLVYFEKDGTLYFASEIKALLKVPGLPKELDSEALAHYFTYMYAPAPLTFFKGLKKLEPGSYVQVNAAGLKIKKYWSIDYSKKWLTSENEYIEKYLALLEEIVRQQSISDVPLGVMLSGGIDSSTLAYQMHKNGAKEIRSFCLGFERADQPDPEFIRARQIADKYSGQHHEVMFDPARINNLPRIITNYDEPLNLFPVIYADQLAAFMKQNATVVLAGNGADELFGGYTGYNAMLKMEIFNRFASILPLVGKGRLRKILRRSKVAPSQRRAEAFRAGHQALSAQLFTPAWQKRMMDVDVGTPVAQAFEESGATDYLDGILYGDLKVYHAFGHLIMPDISGMSNSLEIRSPFLDYKLVEFAASLPREMKVKSIFNPALNKYIMKKAAQKFLPTDLIYAHKMGFGYNIDWPNWLKTSWREKVNQLLGSSANWQGQEIFNRTYVENIIDEHSRGRANHASLIWGLIVFMLWKGIYLDGQPPETLQ